MSYECLDAAKLTPRMFTASKTFYLPFNSDFEHYTSKKLRKSLLYDHSCLKISHNCIAHVSPHISRTATSPGQPLKSLPEDSKLAELI